jgi:hypothetical protein
LIGSVLPVGGSVAIIPFLNGQAFEPETVEAMGLALKKACKSLGLVDNKSDPAIQLVATKIIELARRGEKDAERLYYGALKAFEADG